jgi:hexosaminidase
VRERDLFSIIRSRLIFFLWLSISLTASAQHNPLLPQPQQVAYGSGKLSLLELRIRLPDGSPAEDKFAAKQLSSCIRRRTGVELAIVNIPSSGPQITLNRTGAIDALAQPGEKPGPDSREAYSIVVTSKGGEIRARSSAGLFYGVQTLCQMVEADQTIPAARIEDWPSMAYRGTMVDMSEGPLPTEEEVKRQIDFLSRWKANQYYFYSESSIELAGYPLLNSGARFSRDQIQSIVTYARQRHIDVIPCLELYGHLHDLFRIEKYSGLADFPHGGEFNPRNPRVMKLIANWADQFSAMFPSPFVQIGFDETSQIQQAARLQGKGTTAVDLFIEQLGNVSRLFQQRGKTVMAWADIMVKYPGIITKLPPGTIAVAWYYDPHPDPEYKHWLRPLITHRIAFFVAPGVNSWAEIYPDYDLTFANIDTFLAAGKRSGALGVMNTIWTDDAQMLMHLSYPGMAYGAAAAWQSMQLSNTNFFSEYASQMYSRPVAGEVASALADLNASESHLQNAIGQYTMNQLWQDPFEPSTLQRSVTHQEDLRKSRIFAEDAQEHLDRAANLSQTPAQFDELLFASRLLDYAGLKFLYSAEIFEQWRSLGAHPTKDRLDEVVGNVASQQHGKLADLMDMITGLRPQYKKAWLAQYRPYRLSSALGRWDTEYQYWRSLQARLQSFFDSYRKGQRLPSLASLAGGN